MKKILIIGIIVIVFILFFILKEQSLSGYKTQKATIGNHQLSVEIANSDALRTKGLSGRISMAQDHGMLFVFPTSSYYRFWMIDMKFPLDFIWINKNTVVDLTENVPIPDASGQLPTFTARFPFDKVMEVNAGVIKSLKIKIGETVQF